jgi:hypothetical protein
MAASLGGQSCRDRDNAAASARTVADRDHRDGLGAAVRLALAAWLPLFPR